MLSRREVADRLPTIPEQIALAAKTFRALAAGRVEMPPKTGVHPRKDAFIHAMPSYLMDDDVVAIKWVAGYPDNPSRGLPYINGLIILTDAATGLPLTILDAAEVTAARTAAASGVCVEAFAPPDWSRAAILGAGEQGRYHAAVLRSIEPACEIVGYDPVPGRAERLCDGVIVARDPIEAVDGADVIVTAGPIVKDPAPGLSVDVLPDDCLLLPIDFDFYVQARVVAEATRFVVDSIEQFEYYRSLGHFSEWPVPVEGLGDAVDSPGHAGRVVCANLGVGALDAAFASVIAGA
jgi:ornithine cyclodeaminase/alanine dehydrogenase